MTDKGDKNSIQVEANCHPVRRTWVTPKILIATSDHTAANLTDPPDSVGGPGFGDDYGS